MRRLLALCGRGEELRRPDRSDDPQQQRDAEGAAEQAHDEARGEDAQDDVGGKIRRGRPIRAVSSTGAGAGRGGLFDGDLGRPTDQVSHEVVTEQGDDGPQDGRRRPKGRHPQWHAGGLVEASLTFWPRKATVGTIKGKRVSLPHSSSLH